MKESKVTEIIWVNEWKWDHWVVYYIKMKLENWETINLWKKTKDAFKVWDTVKYETVEEWKKWKEVKENPFKAQANCNNNCSKSAQVGMAIKVAFDLVYEKKWLDAAKSLTKEILLFAQELINEDSNLPS